MEYTVVDVFTSVPLKGNPVAVVLDGSKLSDQRMQDIANWTNLSETTFILPPTNPKADYKVRIFSPIEELPFAGHPTLGTAYAAIDAGIVGAYKKKIVQECARGLISIDRTEDGQMHFGISGITADKISISNDKFARCFPKMKPVGNFMRVNAGPIWIVVQVSNSREELLEMIPNFSEIDAVSRKHNTLGFCVFTGDSDIEMRTFAIGVGEDPVCGSGNAAVAFVRRPHHTANIGNSYISSQGSALNRDGKIKVCYDSGDNIWIGGACTTVARGRLAL